MTPVQRQRRRRARLRSFDQGAPPADAITTEQQWAWSAAAYAGDALAMTAKWDRDFPGWRGFRPPSHVVTLARDAADAWAALAEALGR